MTQPGQTVQIFNEQAFEPALEKILKHEGVEFTADNTPRPGHTGYVDHVDDSGGETNYGITRRVADENGHAGPMQDIPYKTVMRIYKKQYWDRVCGDKIPGQNLAEELFDTAVNCGVEVSVSYLQRVLNAMNKKAMKYPDIKVDGQMGPKTLQTLVLALNVASYYRLCIIRALDALQCVRYINLSERDEKFESFVPGWLRTRVGGHE